MSMRFPIFQTVVVWCLLCLHVLGAESVEPTVGERQITEFMGPSVPTILRLWPVDSERNRSRSGKAEEGKATDQLRVHHIEKPSLLVYAPPQGVERLDAAVIHCPGGGYNYLAMGNPMQFTEWMNHLGITVAVLKYHVPRSPDDPKHLGPLADAQRALRVLRSRAREFGLSADKIGISGASAGGHLAFNACLHQAKPVYEAIDEIDQQSCRPAFSMLFYAAYLSERKGKSAIQASFDPTWLGKETPPMFLTINGDDRGFVMGNLIAMKAMDDKSVPSELHVWTRGGHSGCFDKYPLAEFARPAARYLVRRGILPESALAKSDAWLDGVVAGLRKEHPVVAPAPGSEAPHGLGSDDLSAVDRKIHESAKQEVKTYRLWPGSGTREDDPFEAADETFDARKVPFASSVTIPTMTWFPARKPTGRAVLVFPGGGYGGLAWEHEGSKVADWLSEQGVQAFLVKYRTPRREGLTKHHVALQDAQRAIRMVRAQASAFGVDPGKIGVLGFSAGGHLAALVSQPKMENSYAPIDRYDQASAIADFSILIYPAYMTLEIDGDPLDPLLAPASSGGPTFIASAADDAFTRGQYAYVAAHVDGKTPLEFHVYENGAHGKGILDGPYAFRQWVRECARWIGDLDR